MCRRMTERRLATLASAGIAIGLFAVASLVLGGGGGPALILYSEPGFQGRSLVLTEGLIDLPKESDGFDWNDNVRSIRVLGGTWRLYQHGRFNTELDETPLEDLVLASKAPVAGWSCLVSAWDSGEGLYPDGASGGFGEDISSVELLSSENLPGWAVGLRGKIR